MPDAEAAASEATGGGGGEEMGGWDNVGLGLGEREGALSGSLYLSYLPVVYIAMSCTVCCSPPGWLHMPAPLIQRPGICSAAENRPQQQLPRTHSFGSLL